MYKPYVFQEDEIDLIISFIKSNKKYIPLFVYPTGSGKSIIIANVAIRLEGYYFINVAPSKELVKQNYEKYTSYGYEASICSESLKSREVSKVTFATIGTLKSQIDFYKDKKVVIFDDEAHNGSKRGSQLDLFVKAIKGAKVIGTTATPLRLVSGMGGSTLTMMNKDHTCFYNQIESVIQISKMVKDGFWTPLEYTSKELDRKGLHLNSTGTDYTKESILRVFDSTNVGKKIVTELDFLMSVKKVKSTLVFLTNIEEIEYMQKLYPNSAIVHSKLKDKDRDENIRKFVSGEVPVMFQCDILTTGFDYPALGAVIFWRPTNSFTIWYQGLGRLVRKFGGKKVGYVVDLSGNFEKFGRIEDVTFENNPYTNGWAAFSGDTLLTGYYLGGKVPNRKKLIADYNKTLKPITVLTGINIHFGKYKDQRIIDISKDPKGMSYLRWLYSNKEFKWIGDKMLSVKKEIDLIIQTETIR